MRNLINEGIAAYENNIGAVRHRENNAAITKLTAALNRFLGGVAAVGGFIAILELYLKFGR